jgi:hypothetical protein
MQIKLYAPKKRMKFELIRDLYRISSNLGFIES